MQFQYFSFVRWAVISALPFPWLARFSNLHWISFGSRSHENSFITSVTFSICDLSRWWPNEAVFHLFGFALFSPFQSVRIFHPLRRSLFKSDEKEGNLHKNKFFKWEDLRCVLSICLHDKLNGFSSFAWVKTKPGKHVHQNNLMFVTDGRTNGRGPLFKYRDFRERITNWRYYQFLFSDTPGIRIKIGVALSRQKGNLQGVFRRKWEKKGGERERKKRERYI